MLPLKNIAKGQLKFAPGAEAALRVPHARASARVVAAAALRMADSLMPHARLLASAGVNKDFLRQMRQEARGLAITTRESSEFRRRRRQATAGLAAELKKGRGIVAVMEGMVMLHDRSNIEEWRILRRISEEGRLAQTPPARRRRAGAQIVS